MSDKTLISGQPWSKLKHELADAGTGRDAYLKKHNKSESLLLRVLWFAQRLQGDMEPLKLSTMHSEEFDKHMLTAVDLTPIEEKLEREANKSALEKATKELSWTVDKSKQDGEAKIFQKQFTEAVELVYQEWNAYQDEVNKEKKEMNRSLYKVLDHVKGMSGQWDEILKMMPQI